MKDISEVTALVFDHGLFLPLAHRLAKGFKRVLYHTHAESAFTRLNDVIVGDGYADIERCDDWFSELDEIDLFVFPDIQHSGEQLYLEKIGKPVWGSRRGDSLEINREKFHQLLGKMGLEVPEYTKVTGLTKLREFLADQQNVYLKISRFRGSMETCKFRNMDLDEGKLDELAVKFGPAKDLIPFLVFTELKTDLEIGGDTYCVDGHWPSLMLHGDEKKDRAYLAAVTKREEMPEPIREILAALGPVLKQYRYRNQISFEDRVLGEKHYYIDATQRGGLPSSNSQYALWKNLPEIYWRGAHGELVNPEAAAKFSAECILTMKTPRDAWGKIRIPAALKEHMHCSGCCEIDGATCFPHDPDKTGTEIGWLTATGDTLAETVGNMLELADKLPDGVDADTDALVDILAEIQAGEAAGIRFTDQPIPEPATALNI